jgi:hypothetical protein
MQQQERALIARVERMSYADMVRTIHTSFADDPMFHGVVGEVFGSRLRRLLDEEHLASRACRPCGFRATAKRLPRSSDMDVGHCADFRSGGTVDGESATA